MRAIPVPVRERILRLYEQGKNTREIAEFAGFCVAAVRRVRQQFRARGTLEPQTHLCGRKTLLTPRARPVCKSWWPANPTPRWPNWARAWIVRLGLRRWICGCVGWG